MSNATPERLEQIRAMRATGATLHEIGVHFGITRQRVWQILNPKPYERVPEALRYLRIK